MIAIVACEFHSYGRKGIHLRPGRRVIMLAPNVRTGNAAAATCQPCSLTGNKLTRGMKEDDDWPKHSSARAMQHVAASAKADATDPISVADDRDRLGRH